MQTTAFDYDYNFSAGLGAQPKTDQSTRAFKEYDYLKSFCSRFQYKNSKNNNNADIRMREYEYGMRMFRSLPKQASQLKTLGIKVP